MEKKRKTICGKQKKQNVKGRKGKMQQNISKTPGAAEIGLLIVCYSYVMITNFSNFRSKKLIIRKGSKEIV